MGSSYNFLLNIHTILAINTCNTIPQNQKDTIICSALREQTTQFFSPTYCLKLCHCRQIYKKQFSENVIEENIIGDFENFNILLIL